jgi:methionyl-tRNA formyltransferase
MSSTSAVFVGDGTLLARCAQAWLEAGHRVQFVATRNAEVAQWARDNGVAHGMELPEDAADYLFSIANLQVLPASVMGRARRLAINFHDGPLPRYAGLNAPAWALLNNEREHGVTWHEMTARVDAGRIAKQVKFPLAGDETALDLNARCYEAGLASFAELAGDIARDALVLTPQAGERSWYGRGRRPDALATIDFTRTARDIASMVRALDFGGYPNPLARPKVLLHDRVAFVKQARVAETSSGAPAGTVISSMAGVITVATADGDVILSGVDAQPAVGGILPILDAPLRDALNAACSRRPVVIEPVDPGAVAWIAATHAEEQVTVHVPSQCRRDWSAGSTRAFPLR